MAETCEVCQEHAKAFDAAPTDTERRMLVVVWRHHDREVGHRVIRYLFEDEGLVSASLED
jgi:hypothetical protein